METVPHHIEPKTSHLEKGVSHITTGIKIIDGKHNDKDFESFVPALRTAERISDVRVYKISKISENSKFSRKYKNCTGVVMVGIDRETKKNISFLTHQNPVDFLRHDEKPFTDELTKRTQEFIKRCTPGTIDARIVGGNKRLGLSIEYKESLEKIVSVVEPLLGFRPAVVMRPKLGGGDTSVFFDTKNRRLYLLVTKQPYGKSYEDFDPADKDAALEDIAYDIVLPKEDDWERLKQIRLESLEKIPQAYVTTYEKETGRREQEWRKFILDMHELKPKRQSVFVEHKGEYVGMITANKIDNHTWTLGALYLREELRGTGLSEKLLHTIEARLKILGAKKIDLMVNATLTDAVKFYDKNSYSKIDIVEGVKMGDGKKYNELYMSKSVH